MKRIILAALAFVLIGSACTQDAGHRVGIVVPDRSLSVDPSAPDGGLAAQVGFVGFNSAGDKAWEKYGTGNSQWQLVGHNPVVFDSRDFNGGAVLNLLTTTSNYLLTPSLPGYYCVPLGGSAAFKFVVTAATGSTPVAPTGNFGNNGTTRTNFVASTAGVPISNSGFSLGAPYTLNVSVSSAIGPFADLATPIGLDVTVAGTTATTWAGFILTTCDLYHF